MIYDICIVPVKSISLQPEISGEEGNEMIATCTAHGGRPAATVSWVVPDELEFLQRDTISLLLVSTLHLHMSIIGKFCCHKDDETFESVSILTFIPSANEHKKEVICQAINDVMEIAIEEKATLNVACKYKVRFSLTNSVPIPKIFR